MSDLGWIKLHRQSLESSVWTNATVWKVWCWCLLKANHKARKFIFNGEEIEVSPGQFITGRVKAAKESCVSEQQWRTATKILESTGRITIKPTNKFSIITILKWKQYQNDNQETNQPITNEQPINHQPLTTNKNEENVKNEDNTYMSNSTPAVLNQTGEHAGKMNETDFKAFWELYPRKEKKTVARVLFLAIDKTLLPTILSAVKKASAENNWKTDAGKYIPLPNNWLKEKRWEDEGVSLTTEQEISQLKKQYGAEEAIWEFEKIHGVGSANNYAQLFYNNQ